MTSRPRQTSPRCGQNSPEQQREDRALIRPGSPQEGATCRDASQVKGRKGMPRLPVGEPQQVKAGLLSWPSVSQYESGSEYKLWGSNIRAPPRPSWISLLPCLFLVSEYSPLSSPLMPTVFTPGMETHVAGPRGGTEQSRDSGQHSQNAVQVAPETLLRDEKSLETIVPLSLAIRY